MAMKRSGKNNPPEQKNGLLKRRGRILVHMGRIPDIDIEETIWRQRDDYRGQ
jgi:hypothetical protein